MRREEVSAIDNNQLEKDDVLLHKSNCGTITKYNEERNVSLCPTNIRYAT